MEKAHRQSPPERGFIVAVLWICAAGALWLLFSPAAFERRALQLRTTALEADVHTHWLRNIGLERWRDGLQNDPSVIEREARKLGYGRPGEELVPVAPNSDVLSLEAEDGQSHSWWLGIRHAAATSLILIIAGSIAIMFLIDLKIEDPGDINSREPQ